MSLMKKIRKHGLLGSAKKVAYFITRKIQTPYNLRRVRDAPKYCSPDDNELTQIEKDLLALNITVENYTPSVSSFKAFKASEYFPLDYHGGIDGPVWDEKLLEHWIAYELLGLADYQQDVIYIDIAAGDSPWAKKLHDQFQMSAYAIDLNISATYKDTPFYKIENATSTTFENASVSGASLQCAYEMFMHQDDMLLWKEMARVLKPGGKVIIAPLYLHTHYSSYSTPDYFGKGHSDSAATEYVCTDWLGIPSARFYDANQLKIRVLDTITSLGMQYKLLILKNKSDLGKGIYCHFILEVTK